MYSFEEVLKSSKGFFNGDELATKVFMTKYSLKNNNNEYLELNPDDMHKRISK
jgi:ribonucleoside-diphosphate reductase alpha chain